MNKIVFLFSLMVMAISLSNAQTIDYPAVNKKSAPEITIKSVNQTLTFTQINFVYKNSTTEGQYIYLLPPGNKDAFNIKANGKIYDLLFFQNISNKVKTTFVGSGKEHTFFARFEKLPEDVSIFDLIEGEEGPWDFYGVRIKGTPLNDEEIKVKKFRNDYNNIAFFDPEKDIWSDWDLAEHTFVFNHNDRGDIMHLRPNGKTVIFRSISGAKEGKTEAGEEFQFVEVLDEDGDICTIQLFSNPEIGLILRVGDNKVQFANF